MNPSGLLPRQVPVSEHLARVLRETRGAADASDTGTGKTYVACSLVREFNVPTLVVCPKSLVSNWHRVAAHMGTELSAINYEMVRTGRTPFGSWVPPANGRGKWFQWSDEIRFLIFDEAHRAKGVKTQNSALVFAAARQRIPTLVVSATLAESPMDMRSIGFLLGLHNGTDFYKWIRSQGCRPGPFGGFIMSGSRQQQQAAMARIHAKLFPARGVRVRVADLPDFPETQITAELYDVQDPSRVDALWAEMEDALEALHERKAQDRDQNNPLTRLLRARQELELLKVPVLVEICNDAVEQGQSVAIFATFKQTLRELSERLNTRCLIWGEQTGDAGAKEREANRQEFQADKERVILLSEAGDLGLDLHDLHGNHPRLALHLPVLSARSLRQRFGRVHREGAKTKSLQRVIFAAGTVERRMHAKLTAKLDRLDALNDADLTPNNLVLEEATNE